MKSIIKKIVLSGIAIFLLMQLYQPARNRDYGQVSVVAFSRTFSVPVKVQTILQTSCYDCHSKNSNYPWYSNIQPVRAFMDSHIKEAKENLNFSEFGTYSNRKQQGKLDRMIKQIKSDEMPLASYALIHENAALNKESKAVLLNWIEETKDSISKNN
jgi:hypothetical protein